MTAIFDWIDALPEWLIIAALLLLIALLAIVSLRKPKQNPSHDKSPARYRFDGKSMLAITHEEHAALHGFKLQQTKSPEPTGIGNGASANIHSDDTTSKGGVSNA